MWIASVRRTSDFRRTGSRPSGDVRDAPQAAATSRLSGPRAMEANSSKTAVYAALIGNALVAATKIGGALWTGSSVMMSEAVHSVADTANESLLLYGYRRASLVPAFPSTGALCTYGAAANPESSRQLRRAWALVRLRGGLMVGRIARLACGQPEARLLRELYQKQEPTCFS